MLRPEQRLEYGVKEFSLRGYSMKLNASPHNLEFSLLISFHAPGTGAALTLDFSTLSSEIYLWPLLRCNANTPIFYVYISISYELLPAIILHFRVVAPYS